MAGKDYGKFVAVDVSGGLDVMFRQSENCSVIVETQDNLTNDLDIFVRDDILHIHFEKSTNMLGRPRYKAYIFAPRLEAAALSGSAGAADWDTVVAEDFSLTVSGSVNININVEAAKLDVNASGSSVVRLSGKADLVSISQSGSGSVDTFDLPVRNAVVVRSGSGRVDVAASDSLDVVSRGSGEVRYKGYPSITQSVSGSGSIHRVN